jgi:hypothetical protein
MKGALITVIIFLFLTCCGSKDDPGVDLKTNGIKFESGRAIAWFPKDSLPESRMKEIVDSLNFGIVTAQKFLQGPLEWQYLGNKSINYYFLPGNFVSNFDGESDVSIPLFRIRDFKAPWLHETMHALLRSKKGNWNESSDLTNYFSMPSWFIEGMAEFIATKIAQTDSIKKFDLMHTGGYLKVDSVCSTIIHGEFGSFIQSSVGESGVPTKLITDRRSYARPFYTCSCSFTKYLAEKYGLDKMLVAISSFEEEQSTIEKLTGKKLEDLKSEWLNSLKRQDSQALK